MQLFPKSFVKKKKYQNFPELFQNLEVLEVFQNGGALT